VVKSGNPYQNLSFFVAFNKIIIANLLLFVNKEFFSTIFFKKAVLEERKQSPLQGGRRFFDCAAPQSDKGTKHTKWNERFFPS